MPLQEQINSQIIAGLRISIDIQLKDDVRGMKNLLTLSSIVEEVLDDDSLLIHMPIYQGYHYPMPRDDLVLMKFFIDPTVYGLPLQFVQRIERDGIVFAKMQRAGKIEEHQQRDCYRLPCNLHVDVQRPYKIQEKKSPKAESGDSEEAEQSRSRMINFSDGGMLLATDEDIERGEKVTLTFDIGQIETVEGLALRSEKIEDGTYLYRVAIQFLGVDKNRRHRFYKYIVNKQLEERRRRI